jgi:hypothetical protein
MTENQYALKEFLTAVGVTASTFVVFIIVMLVIINLSSGDKPINESSFEVVDKYDNRCNVIRYTPDNSARYVYFLDCEKNK